MHNGYTQAEGVANLDGCPRPAAWWPSAIPKLRRRPRRLRPLHRHLPAGHSQWRNHLRRRRPAAPVGQAPALERRCRHAHPLSGPPRRRVSPIANPAALAYTEPPAPVAQLDRALPSEGRGHRFESCRVRQFSICYTFKPTGIGRPVGQTNGASP